MLRSALLAAVLMPSIALADKVVNPFNLDEMMQPDYTAESFKLVQADGDATPPITALDRAGGAPRGYIDEMDASRFILDDADGQEDAR